MQGEMLSRHPVPSSVIGQPFSHPSQNTLVGHAAESAKRSIGVPTRAKGYLNRAWGEGTGVPLAKRFACDFPSPGKAVGQYSSGSRSVVAARSLSVITQTFVCPSFTMYAENTRSPLAMASSFACQSSLQTTPKSPVTCRVSNA